MAQSFDLIVIGVGTAASTAANKCAKAGWSVAVVDELPYGGTCALRGCDPKKILRRGAEIVSAAQLMRGKGIDEGTLKINWADLVAYKRSFTEKMPDAIENGLQKNTVTTLHGAARFTGPNQVAVDGKQMEGRHILVASGAKPAPLPIPGSDHLIDSTEFMELTELPPRILFVGGGYISFEFAHMAARAGSEVTVVQRGDRVLKGFDPDLVDLLVKRSVDAGIDVQLRTSVDSIEETAEGLVVSADQEGRKWSRTADLVVHGAGRVPAIDDLDLEVADIKASKAGVEVNEYLQSVTNPAIYAAGDVADTAGALLTPVASLEGKVAASNMLKGNSQQPDYRGIPSVAFTLPELARVGMLESEAREEGHDVRVEYSDTSGWYSNLRVGEYCAAVKILIDKKTDDILGAHMLGPEYGEVINIISLAMKLGLKAKDVKSMVAVYPSVGSDLSSMF